MLKTVFPFNHLFRHENITCAKILLNGDTYYVLPQEELYELKMLLNAIPFYWVEGSCHDYAGGDWNLILQLNADEEYAVFNGGSSVGWKGQAFRTNPDCMDTLGNYCAMVVKNSGLDAWWLRYYTDPI